jgi:hypothetical protein
MRTTRSSFLSLVVIRFCEGFPGPGQSCLVTASQSSRAAPQRVGCALVIVLGWICDLRSAKQNDHRDRDWRLHWQADDRRDKCVRLTRLRRHDDQLDLEVRRGVLVPNVSAGIKVTGPGVQCLRLGDNHELPFGAPRDPMTGRRGFLISRRISAQGKASPEGVRATTSHGPSGEVASSVSYQRVREARIDGGAMSRPSTCRRLGPAWFGHHPQEVRAW